MKINPRPAENVCSEDLRTFLAEAMPYNAAGAEERSSYASGGDN